MRIAQSFKLWEFNDQIISRVPKGRMKMAHWQHCNHYFSTVPCGTWGIGSYQFISRNGISGLLSNVPTGQAFQYPFSLTSIQGGARSDEPKYIVKLKRNRGIQ